jgi:hypothetical protein
VIGSGRPAGALLEGLGGALLGLLAGGLSGLQLLIHLDRRGAGLLGVGLLPAAWYRAARARSRSAWIWSAVPTSTAPAAISACATGGWRRGR